jgi:hypothetical protein
VPLRPALTAEENDLAQLVEGHRYLPMHFVGVGGQAGRQAHSLTQKMRETGLEIFLIVRIDEQPRPALPQTFPLGVAGVTKGA